MFSSDIVITKIKISIHCFPKTMYKISIRLLIENLIFPVWFNLTLMLYNKDLVLSVNSIFLYLVDVIFMVNTQIQFVQYYWMHLCFLCLNFNCSMVIFTSSNWIIDFLHYCYYTFQQHFSALKFFWWDCDYPCTSISNMSQYLHSFDIGCFSPYNEIIPVINILFFICIPTYSIKF